MLDRLLYRQIEPRLPALIVPLSARPVTPTMLSAIGFVLGVAGCFCVGMGFYIPGLVLLLAGRFADLLDGALARATDRQTDRGAFLNIVLTKIVYAAFLFLFALSTTNAATAAAFVLFAYAAMNVSENMYALLALKNGKLVTSAPLIGHTETILFMALCCVKPDMFAVFAALFGLACCVSVFNDIWKALRDF